MFKLIILIFLCLAAAITLKMWLRLFRPKLRNITNISGMEEVRFFTRDYLALNGIWHEGNSDKPVVLVCHGVTGNISDVLPIANMFMRHGFGVFCFDFRGHGNSDGRRTSYGFHERLDVMAAIHYLKNSDRLRSRPLYVYALSMGAAAMLLAAHELRKEKIIEGCILDSCFSRFEPLMRKDFANWPQFLQKLVIPSIVWISTHMFNVPLLQINPIVGLSDLETVPKLFIHSRTDELVPLEHTQTLLETASDPKQVLYLEQCEHADGFLAYPQIYEEALLKFVQSNSA